MSIGEGAKSDRSSSSGYPDSNSGPGDPDAVEASEFECSESCAQLQNRCPQEPESSGNLT